MSVINDIDVILMNPLDLKYFLAVSETLNVSRAAERLGVGQPALSMALKRLETATKSQLLIRQKTGVQLSSTGRLLAARGRKILEDLDQLGRALTSSQQKIEGRYTLGCHPSVASHMTPAFLPKLLHSHPSLEIHFAHGLSREILEEVISFKVDFGIVVNPTRHPDLVIHELTKDEVSFWAADNACEDVLICDADLNQTQDLLRRIGNHRAKIFNRFLYSKNLEVIAHLTSKGCGIGVLPGRVANLHHSKTLKRYGTNWPSYSDRICLVYRADQQRTAATKTVIEAIKSAKF